MSSLVVLITLLYLSQGGHTIASVSRIVLFVYVCLSVAKQDCTKYNIIWYPAKGVISLAWKVTTILVESNSRLPPGI